MKRVQMIGLWLVLAVGLGAAACTTATASKAGADLGGTWRIDLERSDSPRREGLGGGRRDDEHGTRARDGARDGKDVREKDGHETDGRERGSMRSPDGFRSGGPRGARGRRGPRFLPQTFVIQQRADGTLRFVDESGTTVRVIETAKGSVSGRDAISGQWKGRELVVERSGRGKVRVIESYALEDGGRTLVIRTERKADEGERSRTMRRVYRRVSA